jgi:hypothetical protein
MALLKPPDPTLSENSGEEHNSDNETPESTPDVEGLVARSALFLIAGMAFSILGLLFSLGYWILGY